MGSRPGLKNTPLVTVGLLTYNRLDSLKEALDGIRSQTYERLDILIADNASTDGTERYCRQLAEEDPRIRYYRHEKNIGPEANFRFALESAEGRYFMWHADDDILEPAFIKKAVDLLETDPETVSCCCDYRFIDEEGVVTRNWTLEHLYPGHPWTEGQTDFFRHPGRSVMAIYGLHRTNVVQEVGHPGANTFRSILSGHEAPFLARLASRGRIVALPEPLFNYREHLTKKDSLAHSISDSLRGWELVLLYLTIQTKLAISAVAARTNLRQRLRLVGVVLATIWLRATASNGRNVTR